MGHNSLTQDHEHTLNPGGFRPTQLGVDDEAREPRGREDACADPPAALPVPTLAYRPAACDQARRPLHMTPSVLCSPLLDGA